MPDSLLKTYLISPDRYDEMVAFDGQPRSHWRPLLEHLGTQDDEVLDRRIQFIQDAIETDGVSYNIYGDEQGTKRLWELDALPLLMPAQEWATLSEAVAQRATLLDAVLGDLYGEQQLVAEGFLPPALVYGQRAFKWPCVGHRPPSGHFLQLYAVDVARAPDGHWWVIADRTQGPSGAGYALQNRIILSRAFPDAFRELQVEPLANFFRALQDGFARFSPNDGESPLVVLLTPGPYNETYFEHAFLARYLGFPLVEGQDLTVRDDTVYLKTLKGLRRVHGILRRLDDDFCDPLELRADSALGVPGLMHAVRAGRVYIGNALGSGVLESGALFGFLPGVCQRMLGEPLKMPSVASWWCGEAPALDYALDHLDDLVIKAAFPSMRMEPVFGHQLKGEARKEMVARIQAQPHAYVAQEWVRLSQAPVWGSRHDHRAVPRSFGMRLFATATPNGFVVMPGALGRVAPRHGVEVISMQRGGLSKDVWIPSEGPVHRTTLLKSRLGVIDLVCTGSEIPSRVGENLFWMGRYAERCEASARLLRSVLSRLSSRDDDDENVLPDLLAACRRIEILPKAEKPLTPGETEKLVIAAVCNPKINGSVASNIQALTFSADQVRERLSSDNWHALTRLARLFENPTASTSFALTALDRVMLDCISLAGFAMDDMVRDEGWRFLILGRRIERLAGLSGLIGGVLGSRRESRERSLEWLLETANSIVTYRARYRRTPEVLPVVHLLVFDESNPHAVAFQIFALERYLARTSRELGLGRPDTLHSVAEQLQDFDLTRLEAEDAEDACADLAVLLRTIRATAFALSDEVHRRFFIHTGEVRQ
ncbi:MAG: circularly permuted type 2 ATP-grasp protein [Zoogloeaceae bacterium]|nr:circularly permuted type 2 ATP-grasp protein [Zoogloeaceae bacterium]